MTDLSRRGGPAVFLDAEGTLVEPLAAQELPWRAALVEGAGESAARLQRAGFSLVVVTNRSAVGRGAVPPSEPRALERRIRALMKDCGADLSGFFWCPHHPLARLPRFARVCECRKPEPGLILAACRRKGLAASKSWCVGDLPHDVEAGRRAGCRTILLGPAPEARGSMVRPDFCARDLREAAAIILSRGSPA